MRIFLFTWMALSPMLLEAGPVELSERSALLRDEGDTRALLATDQYVLTRSADARDEDFKDLYYLNLEDAQYDRLSLERFGQVLVYQADALAVLKIPASNLERAASELHEERWACGQLIRLFGDEVRLLPKTNQAVPIIPVEQSIEAIPAIHASVSPERIRQTVEAMVGLGTRYGRSTDAGAVTDLLIKLYKNLTQSRSDVSFEKIEHSGYKQPSLVIRIQGQTRPDEIVVLGSHIDSIARGSSLAPGADDNASGTASQLEVFQTIMKNKLRFDRTVEIHGYALEELGLVGSQDIARRYVSSGRNVIAMLQNDMNMFKASKEDMVWLVTNDSDPQLTANMETLLRNYQTVAVDKNRLTAGTSDHRAWYRQGIPVVFPTENPTSYNRKIHTPNDTIANAGAFTQSAEFVKLSLSFLAHFAGLQPST